MKHILIELKKFIEEKNIVILLPRQRRPDGAHSDPVPDGPIIIDGIYLVRERK